MGTAISPSAATTHTAKYETRHVGRTSNHDVVAQIKTIELKIAHRVYTNGRPAYDSRLLKYRHITY